MLQRIQTVYLLLAFICMVVSLFTNLAMFSYVDGTANFKAMGFYNNGELLFSTWSLLVIGIISAVLFLIIIFIYKWRILQIRFSIFNIFIILGYYGLIAFYILKRNPEANSVFERAGIGMVLPFVAIVFSYLAIRKIAADEALIRSLNRIR